MAKKAKYCTPVLQVETFDERDLITESPSNFDGVGFIPEDWFFGA